MKNRQQFIHTIQDGQSLEELIQEISAKDKDYYTFNFKMPINNKHEKTISIDEFWQLAKVKAKKVSLFVDEIIACDDISKAPMGFIREITMPGNDVTQGTNNSRVNIKERVIVDEDSKTLLFFQLETTGNVLLYAINQVFEENNQVCFSGHYVYSIKLNSIEKADKKFMSESNQYLPLRIKSMISKMKELMFSGQLDETYNELYNNEYNAETMTYINGLTHF